jgi:hypothetical protein
MNARPLYFVIPTYRLRDVGETVEAYDEHFWRNGHAPRIIVFDDSSPVAQEKYYPILEQTRTHNEVYYVGPKEKEQFTAYLSHRLRDKRLDGLIKNLFRPSYGGNRNFTLMYTLGGLMISADDDMRPYALMESSLESLDEGEISRGRLHRADKNGYVRKSFDVVGSFLDILGKRTGDAPANYETGEVLIDTAMDLETNASKGVSRENSLLLRKGARRRGATRGDTNGRDDLADEWNCGRAHALAAGQRPRRGRQADGRGERGGVQGQEDRDEGQESGGHPPVFRGREGIRSDHGRREGNRRASVRLRRCRQGRQQRAEVLGEVHAEEGRKDQIRDQEHERR